MTRRVGIYGRLSKDRDGQSTSIDRQEYECQEYAEKRGWEVVEIYADSNLSGFRPNVVRPAFNRMLEDLEAGRIDTVVIFKLDRLTRQPRQSERMIDLCEKTGAEIHSVTETLDITESNGRLMLRVLVGLASHESENTSTRVKAQKREAARLGKPKGGPRPFGYGKDHITIVPEEAALIREATNRVLQGESLRSICLDWERRGVKTTSGKGSFHSANLKKILVRWRYAGIREHHGEPVGKAEWDAIVSEDQLKAVRALLLRDDKRSYLSRSFMLKGLLVCGKCGCQMQGNYGSGGLVRYQCQKQPNTPACGKTTVQARHLDPYIWDQLTERTKKISLETLYDPAEDVAPLLLEQTALKTQLEKLREDYYLKPGLMSESDFDKLSGRLIDLIQQKEAEIAQASTSNHLYQLDVGTSLEEAWERPTYWKAELLQAAIHSIVVGPGKRGTFDYERFEINWKL
jgi:site-specific DNA recombinase